MKITLEFSDKEEAGVFLKAPQLASVVDDFQRFIRGLDKYGDSTGKTRPECVVMIREKWGEILSENGVDPYED